MSDGDKLLEAWWKIYGIEPVTSAHLGALTGDDWDQVSTRQELKSIQTEIGVKLSVLIKKGHDKYTVKKLQVGSQAVNFLRLKDWSKHGPVN